MDTDLDKFSQVLKGTANDDLIAEKSCFVFNYLFCVDMFCWTRFKDE